MSIIPFDAAVLDALHRCEATPEHLDAMSPQWRPLAETLVGLPLGKRGDAMTAALRQLPPADADAINTAMDEHGSDGMPPIPSEDGPEPETAVAPRNGTASASARPLGKPSSSVVMRRASDITALPVEWLWKDRLPLGMLSLFAGDPKLGKSFATVGLAAAVSRGAPLPMGDMPDGPASVIVMSAEDDPARTIVPRLKSAGARLENVHILESIRLADGSEALPSLRADIEAIEAAAAALGDCRLIIIDPISAYLGGTDDHKNGELRGVLSPLKSLAERLNIAVLLVTHLNKGAGTNGKHRVTGSIAYVGACRANFLFARDRDDTTGRRVLMLDNGCNLAGDVPTLAYRIEDRGDGPAVEWDADPVNITADEALRAANDDRRPADDCEAGECDRWLRETLATAPVAAAEIFKHAANAGFSKDQTKRAKARIHATSKREGFGSDSRVVWLLSCDTPAADDAA